MQPEYYYVTQQTDKTNNHLLHRAGCVTLPGKETLIFIGSLYNTAQALTVAQMRVGKNVKACYHCCSPQNDARQQQKKMQSRHHSDN